MPRGSKILGKPIDESKWEKAKKLAADQGHADEYDYIMGIYKRMNRLSKGIQYVIGGDLDELRCPGCNALLLKGKNFEKSIIEVKCRRCSTLVSNI